MICQREDNLWSLPVGITSMAKAREQRQFLKRRLQRLPTFESTEFAGITGVANIRKKLADKSSNEDSLLS
jgi:hypothetical protein